MERNSQDHNSATFLRPKKEHFCLDKNEPCLTADFHCNYVREKGFIFLRPFSYIYSFPFCFEAVKSKDGHLKDRPEAILLILQFFGSMEISFKETTHSSFKDSTGVAASVHMELYSNPPLFQ